jgi:filamentous hemagglutinin family protein
VFNYPENRRISMKSHTAQAVYGTIGAVTFGLAMNATTVQAQIIATPTGDPGATGTIITPINTQIDITGGTQAGSALFHSFTQFDVSKGQTANFQTPADIQNVLTRVTNGVPSTIDGTLQLSGAKANLYFMNPAGIVFGPNVNLNLPASFVATTADSIGYDWTIKQNAWSDSHRSFNATGENTFDHPFGTDPNPGGIRLVFNDPANVGQIINSGNLSLQKDTSLSLIGGSITSTTDINTPSSVLIQSVLPISNWSAKASGNTFERISPTSATGTITLGNINALGNTTILGNQIKTGNINSGGNTSIEGRTAISTGNLTGPGNPIGSYIILSAIDITTGTISTSGGVSIDGSQAQTVQTGNISAKNIGINTDESAAATSITTGHLKSDATLSNYIIIAGMSGVIQPSGIELSAGKIKVASIFAKSIAEDPSTGSVSIKANDSFQITDTILETADLGRVRSDITSPNTTETPISIAGSRINITQPGTQWLEGTSLEHDANNYVVYRLNSDPEVRVDIIAVNPQDGGLILKNQATGEIIVGDNVIIRSANVANPSNISTTKGLVVGLDPNQKSLAELTGKLKRQFKEDSSTYQVEEYRYGGNHPARISVRNPGFGPDKIDGPIGTFIFLAPLNLKSANPIGGPLPGSVAHNPNIITAPLPLSPDVQAAINQHNQKTAAITTPAPTLTLVPATESTPEPSAPNFDRSSILNGTIDPTDTINLSAGAIRGATINPGGLLKVELDTRNPEGILTRKVITK